jgi:uncharacterized protein YbgA (DUF1722 family)
MVSKSCLKNDPFLTRKIEAQAVSIYGKKESSVSTDIRFYVCAFPVENIATQRFFECWQENLILQNMRILEA